MDNKLRNFLLLAMATHRNDNLREVEWSLTELFKAESVRYVHSSILQKKTSASNFIPIYLENRMVGYYEIVNADSTLDREEMKFIIQILNKMHENISDYNMNLTKINSDQMTRMFNKNCFITYCQDFDCDTVNSLSCIFIDINGLFEINDTLGHNCGDKVIVRVADIIRDIFPSDLCFRIGGDEYVVIIANKNELYIQNEIADLKRTLAKESIFVSCGFARKTVNIDINELVKEADVAMYKEKQEYYSSVEHDRRNKGRN